MYTIGLISGSLGIDDFKDVQAALWDARDKWYNIGVQLNMSIASLDAIRRENRDNPDTCFNEMLSNWLRNGRPPLTWNNLADALRSRPVGCGHLIRYLPPHSN